MERGEVEMAVAVKTYYDGSGPHFGGNGRRILALGGHAAIPEVWDAFERDWWAVLADSSSRPVCRSLHMADAKELRRDFSPERAGLTIWLMPFCVISLTGAFLLGAWR
jgi:hypothetical protein